jgi:hypothetical protein
MTVIIDRVEVTVDPAVLLGAHVETPVPSSEESRFHGFQLSGWAVGRGRDVSDVLVVPADRLLRSDPWWRPEPLGRAIPVCVPRPDVAAHLGLPSVSDGVGFNGAVGLLGLPPLFELDVQVRFGDGGRTTVATLAGRRTLIESAFQPRFQPLVVTMIGRSGSTWLMRLLASHPEIVVHGAPPYEVRAACYWMQLARVLNQPSHEARYAEWADGMNQAGTTWGHPYSGLVSAEDTPVARWFGADYLQHTAAFAQQSIDGFYAVSSTHQHKPRASYFAEKWELYSHQGVCAELYPRWREIILVRDPCDVICSISAFNAQRGHVGFGRMPGESDERFVSRMRPHILTQLRTWNERSDHAFLLRYEDLVRDPRQTLSSLFRHLGVDCTTQEVQDILYEAGKPSAALDQHITAPTVGDSVGRWRREFTPALQAHCEAAFAEVRSAFGYA